MKHAILIILLVLVSSTSAEIVTVEVTGLVDSVQIEGDFALDGSISPGSEMTGFCTYDTDAPDLNPSEYNGKYALISISMTIGNCTFTHNQTSPDPAVLRVYTTDPVYSASSSESRFDGTILVDGSPKTYDDIVWSYAYSELFNLWTSSGEYIPTDALPHSGDWPDISVFDMRRMFEARFYDQSSSGSSSFQIRGDVTSLAVTPEPATIFLFAVTGLLIRKNNHSFLKG